MDLAQKAGYGLAAAFLLALVAGLLLSHPALWQPSLVAFFVCIAITLRFTRQLSGLQYTAWILTSVAAAMVYPERFLRVGPVDMQNKHLVLLVVQLVMFGMGTRMSLRDFQGVLKMPYPVFVGVGLQFLIMPLTGYALAKTLGLPAEVAAGVVLIGSCSSGLASNVMCYLAGANLALSITLTAVATMLAPLATPFWMWMLAGEFVEVAPVKMMVDIAKIVLVPIGAALLHDLLKRTPGHLQARAIGTTLAAGLCLTAVGLVLLWRGHAAGTADATLTVGGALLFALAYHFAVGRWGWVDRSMPMISMLGIVYFTAIATAAGRDNLMVCGVTLVVAAVLHNLAGYGFGYGLSRLLGLDKQSSLTVAFEVGMQNGGMATGLARGMDKLATVGLAAAVFSPWMNVSGSILANLIRKRGRRQELGQTQLAGNDSEPKTDGEQLANA